MLLTWLYIVWTLIRHVLLIRSGHTELLIPSGYAAILFASSVGPSVANATWRHCLSHFIDRVAARTCCAVDFFFFLLSWPWWTRSVVKHNMLKDTCIYIRKKIVNFCIVYSEFTQWCCSSGSFFYQSYQCLFGAPGGCATNRKVTGSIPVLSLEFFVDIILPIALSHRNECQECFLGLKAAGA